MEDREVKKWYLERRAEDLIANLEKRNFKAKFARTPEEAKAAVLSLIPAGSVVVLTGSQTLEQIGVKQYLRDSGQYKLLDPYELGIDRAENISRRKRGLTADVMLSSTNALTEDGILVNVDGMGNRVAGMIFGPDKVVLAVGMNKVVKDVHQAWQRLRDIARPLNSKRLELPNPCAATSYCADCNTPTRICNYFVRIERSYVPDRFHIVLIGQELGY